MSTLPKLFCLALGAFAIGIESYVIAGLLPDLASDLQVSVALAGQLITVFALAYALGSPLLAVAAGNWERRRLLVLALAVFALCNLFAAGAQSYGMLMVARIGLAGYLVRRQRHVAHAQRAGGAGFRRRAIVVDQFDGYAAAPCRAFEQVAVGDRDQAGRQRRRRQPHQQFGTHPGGLASGDGQPDEVHCAQLAWAADAWSGSRNAGTRISI